MPEKKKLLLRIDKALWEALQKMATDEFRSINGQIEYILQNAVRERMKKNKDDKEPDN